MLPTVAKVACKATEIIGSTGRRYRLLDLLQERPHIGCVWTASSNRNKYVLKNVPVNILSNFDSSIWPRLRNKTSPLLRLPVDRIPDRRILVYDYLTDDFLRLIREGAPMRSVRSILKRSIEAIAYLHSRDIVHLDVKPDNIMVNREGQDDAMVIESVQLTDLVNAAHLPNGKCVKGMLAGNDNWRSPEAHFKGETNKPGDIFSSGLVCLFAVTGRVTCGPDEDFAKHESQGALPAMIRLQRQVSYFGDLHGLKGLQKHVGDEDTNVQILDMLWEDRNEDYIPYRSFSEWPEARDEAFRELMQGTMNLDPRKRLNAAQVCKQPWFQEITTHAAV